MIWCLGRLYKSLCLAAVKSLHGDVGLMSEVDVVHVTDDSSALVRVHRRLAAHLCVCVCVCVCVSVVSVCECV